MTIPDLVADPGLVERLIAEGETLFVERKERDPKIGLGATVASFANTLGGWLLIGVDDDGRPSGLAITDRVLQTLSAFRSAGNILPLPTLSVEKRTLAGSDIAIVEVTPSGDPPVRYRGTVWIRVGPRRAVASRDDERILVERRRHGSATFGNRTGLSDSRPEGTRGSTAGHPAPRGRPTRRQHQCGDRRRRPHSRTSHTGLSRDCAATDPT
jgi:hypothetical protein